MNGKKVIKMASGSGQEPSQPLKLAAEQGSSPSMSSRSLSLMVNWKYTWLNLIHFIMLLAILAAAFYVGLLPRNSTRYPVHIDEWQHLALAESTIQAGRPEFPHPLFGNDQEAFELELGPAHHSGVIKWHHEIGFHVMLAEMRLISGVSWNMLFRLYPSLLLILITLIVYIYGKNEGIGLQSASLVVLIPSTLRLLGPGFTVPVSVGLLGLPLILYFIHRFEFKVQSNVVVLIIVVFLALAHPATWVHVVLVIGINSLVFLVLGPGILLERFRRMSTLGFPAVVALMALILLWNVDVVDIVRSGLSSGGGGHLFQTPMGRF